MIPLLLAAALGLAALLVVIQPLLADRRTRPEVGAVSALIESADAERSAKQALLDVELDHRLGNLNDVDYGQLRARYEERALVALKARYDRERALDARIERELAALRDRQTKRQPAKAQANGTPRSAAARGGAGNANRRAPQRTANSVRARRRREGAS